MTIIDPAKAHSLMQKLTSDESELRRIYRIKSLAYDEKSVPHSLADQMTKEGWEEYASTKLRTKLRKPKSHFQKFEDDIWCQLYNLGFRTLNIDSNFKLPFGKDLGEEKQIDVIAANDECILLVECKSSETPKKPPSFKTEFEALKQRLNGHSKVLEQIFGTKKKIKFIFATRNLRISRDSADGQRLIDAGGILHNDNSFDYVENLIRTYKGAAYYQFLSIIFRGMDINKSKIELPAIEGKMGNKTYYMFSIEPGILLKIGFVLHRTRANESEMPTYQRLLVPSRLKGLRRFIEEEEGFFPNSIILNFSVPSRKIEFYPSTKVEGAKSKIGVLKVPNAYATAYIIDGQHRLYGYAETKYKDTNTLPVVAFVGLDPIDQLEMFMSINENQKAVTPTLRITLEEDLYWNAPRLDTRMKALRSSILRGLAEDRLGPLFGKVSLGEDKALLKAKPFAEGLTHSGLIPKAKGNNFLINSVNVSLYNTNNSDYLAEMRECKSNVISLINQCYSFAEESLHEYDRDFVFFILNNRGTYAFVSIVGDVNRHLTEAGKISYQSSLDDRFAWVRRYLEVLFDALKAASDGDRRLLHETLGSGADRVWFHKFQNYIHNSIADYNPADMQIWNQRQDQELQDEGRKLGIEIERHIKRIVLDTLRTLFGENWDLEIGSIQRECESRAKEQEERMFKEGFGRNRVAWTDQFFISDYKKIIEKYWSKQPEEENPEFRSFDKLFSIDVGRGFHKKEEKIKWLSLFSNYRNTWAHAGTKEKGLSQEEVDFLKLIYKELAVS